MLAVKSAGLGAVGSLEPSPLVTGAAATVGKLPRCTIRFYCFFVRGKNILFLLFFRRKHCFLCVGDRVVGAEVGAFTSLQLLYLNLSLLVRFCSSNNHQPIVRIQVFKLQVIGWSATSGIH